MRKVIATLMAGSLLLLLGVACDDNEKGGAQNEKMDEDDTRVGPGDGQDEVGPRPIAGQRDVPSISADASRARSDIA